MTSKKKKVKSVERQKSQVKADIIAVNEKDANQNINKQVVQILFPADTELKKVKKRKRAKPRNTQRNKLLDELKQELEEYDRIQNAVRERKITIPSDLGLTTINTSDLKTNADIKNFIQDVVNKKNKLRELLEKGTQQLQPSPMIFGGNPFGSFQPRIMQPSPFIPQQPQIIPQQTPPVVIPPISIPQQPTQPTQTGEDATAKALREIADETKRELEREGKSTAGIMPPTSGETDTPPPSPTITIPSSERGTDPFPNKDAPSDFNEIKLGIQKITLSMPPQQRIDEGKRLLQRMEEIQNERLKNQQPLDLNFVRERNGLALRLDSIISQSQRDLSSEPSKEKVDEELKRKMEKKKLMDLNLSKEVLDIGGKAQTIEAPAGWSNIVKRILKYQKDIIFDAKEPLPQEFHIPVSAIQNLIVAREGLSDDYNEVMSNFSEQQIAYIDTKYAPIDKRIRQILIEEPKETLKYVYDQQKKPYKSITQAGERSDLQEKVLKDLDAGKKLKDDFMEAELKKIRDQLKKSSDLLKNIGLRTQKGGKPLSKQEGEKFLKNLQDRQKDLNDVYNKLPDTARGLIQSDFENINSKLSTQQGIFNEFIQSGKLKTTKDLQPTKYITYKGRDNDVKLLTEYVDRPDKIYGLKVKEAVKNLFGLSFFNSLEGRSRVDKKTIINEEIGNIEKMSPQEFNEKFSQYKQADYSPFQKGEGQDTREGFEKQKQKDLAEAQRQKDLEEGHSWQFAK
tara:strand:+ start:476 stop:2686 length:2211 start_codon:yes stop_codon:yes gene_type:complete